MSAASRASRDSSTAATPPGLGGAATAANGAIASTIPRLALERVTRLEAETASRMVSPSGRVAAASIAGRIATAAARRSSNRRSLNEACGWTLPGLAAEASRIEAAAAAQPLPAAAGIAESAALAAGRSRMFNSCVAIGGCLVWRCRVITLRPSQIRNSFPREFPAAAFGRDTPPANRFVRQTARARSDFGWPAWTSRASDLIASSTAS